ncbi:glycoside hydrolase family 16 protein [Oligoflexus tunisiensis]|uniref:glycoside hydrolase family 16 protein n=1 Tax=Oligoflexus tunisiensis TaxID=708132 RepID=UPI00114CB55E|nr:glycoside hydrolase family 16 protein [Oligoflexus tunisiensis]
MKHFGQVCGCVWFTALACGRPSVESLSQPADSTEQLLFEDFNRAFQDSIFHFWGGGTALPQQSAADAADQQVVTLTLPKDSPAGPPKGPNLEWRAEPFLFGTIEVRLKTPSCSTRREGNVSGFFTYFNDGSDPNGNGYADNSEIDFEWLCAEPESIYLTIWTDFDEATGAQQRVIRKINLAQGTIEYTRFADGWGAVNTEPLSGAEAQPEVVPALPDYNAAARFYEYGLTWEREGVLFWIVHPVSGEKLVLWNYRGPVSRIPQVPAHLLLNTWHSATWAPEDTPDALEAPKTDLTMQVDWVRIRRP